MTNPSHTNVPLIAFQVSRIPDSGRVRRLGLYASLELAQAACEKEQRSVPLVAGVQMDWFSVPGSPGRWQLHMYSPGVDVPEITDYMVREVPILTAVA